MHFHNETPFAHGLALGLGPDRQPHLGVVVKATYRIPERPGGPLEVADDQIPVASADEHIKGDVTGSVRTEADTVVFKPRADVVLVGHAYAPGGAPVTALDVGLRVGRRQHAIHVVGDRQWEFPARLAVVPSASAAAPFTAMPLVYERAFGGFDHEGRAWSRRNPIGRGFIAEKTLASVDGRPLPNLEDPRRPVRSWDDRPDPVGWGVFGRAWEPRAALAGRATDHLDPTFGLPADFDHGFYNGAHPALQVPGYLAGDEEIELVRVTPDGRRRFQLPGWTPAVALRTRTSAGASELRPFPVVLDTLALFPDDGVLTLTWRAHRALAVNMEAALAQIAAVHIADGRTA